MLSDEKLKNTFKISENNKIIRIDFLLQVIDSTENVRRSELAVEGVYEILNLDPNRMFKLLVNMLSMGESNMPLKSNKVYLQIVKHKQVGKIAIVGNFKKQLKVLSFLLPFIVGEGKKVVWFPNNTEAMLWLEK